MLQGYYGLGDDNLWMLATGLGAGISRQQMECGAVTGGVLAIGLATALQRGSTREDRKGLRDETYSRVQQLTRRFEEQYGSVNCGEMTGCDFRTAEGPAKFKETQGMDLVCRPAVRFVVETVVDLCG